MFVQASSLPQGFSESQFGSSKCRLGFQKQAFQAVESYIESCRVDPFFCKHLLFHLITSSTELEQKPDSHNIKQAVECSVQGKSFLELGCRSAGFLKLLKQHGAQSVFGVTSADYADAAKAAIGGDNIIVNSVSSLTPRQKLILKAAHFDCVLNCNLLEADREGVTEEFKQDFFDVLKKINGLNYIVGSVNKRSFLTSHDFHSHSENLGNDLSFQVDRLSVLPAADKDRFGELHNMTKAEEELLLGTSYCFRLV